jgi:hypothetical protein
MSATSVFSNPLQTEEVLSKWFPPLSLAENPSSGDHTFFILVPRPAPEEPATSINGQHLTRQFDRTDLPEQQGNG